MEPDDTGSVSSQGSRRSSRLRDKKRSREDEEEDGEATASASSPAARPRSRQRRSSSPAGGVRTSARRLSRTTATPMDLGTIPEEVSTTGHDKDPQGGRQPDHVEPLVNVPAQPQLKPAAAPPPIITAQLPPVTPGRLLRPSATTTTPPAGQLQQERQPPAMAVAAAAGPPKSSKKLLSLDHKADTPFKRASIRHDDDYDEDNNDKVAAADGGDDDTEQQQRPVDPLPPEELAPLVPNVPYEEPPPLAFPWRFGQQVLHRHGHRLETLRFWLLLFFVLQVVLYPLTIHPILSATTKWSRRLLPFYQSLLLPPPPPDQTPILQQLRDELAEIHNREKQAIRVLLHKRTELQTLVQGFIAQGHVDLATYQASLPPVVNLSTTPLSLWPITNDNDGDGTAAEACPDGGSGGGGASVAEAAASIRDTYRAQLETLSNASDVDGWIRQHLPGRNAADRTRIRLHQLITDRIERERADFDYTERVLAATGTYVDQLPWLNRLAALWGLRFYGHDATAALLPNRPRGGGGGDNGSSSSSFRGQCWALTPPATVTIQLSKSIHVQSVSIEHPTTIAPKASAIRQFVVYAIDARLRQWPLGNFSYHNEPGGRQDYMVRDEYRGEEIPPVQVVKLVVDSGWNSVSGDDAAVTTCLYRFRVLGEEDDTPPPPPSSSGTTKSKLVHGKNWGQ